jgi:hypothetical protein
MVGSRTLSVGMPVPGGVDGASCQTACYNAGYHLAGTEYSVEVRFYLHLLTRVDAVLSDSAVRARSKGEIYFLTFVHRLRQSDS